MNKSIIFCACVIACWLGIGFTTMPVESDGAYETYEVIEQFPRVPFFEEVEHAPVPTPAIAGKFDDDDLARSSRR